jgi:hypothetical protein
MASLTLALLVPSQAVRAFETPQGATLPSPRDCKPVYSGTANAQGQLLELHSQANIDCIRVGNTTPYGAKDVILRSPDPVPDGTGCQFFHYAPVSFQNLPSYIRGSWRTPDGAGATTRIDPESNGNLVSATGLKAPTNDVFAVYARDGAFQNQVCQAPARWTNFCSEGAPSPNDDPCITSRPHIITPASSPPPPVAPFVAKVVRDIGANAGTIKSLPSPNGLVNLPTCFWIEGVTIPDERDFTLVLQGPPDSSGRSIYYTYLIRVFFAGVDWQFDDPFGNDQVQAHPACGQHPQLTAHSYPMISEKRNPDGQYHVMATEKYQVTVDRYWDDYYGPQHKAEDPGIALPITISPPGPYNQYVGQVEAIPMRR